MKKPHLLLLVITLLFCATSIKSQIVIVSGQCITGSIVLNPIDSLNGKPVYEGTGTVDGTAGVQVDVYWMPAPDSLWVLAFSGQPYFRDSCNITTPPPTGGPCPWAPVAGQSCTGVDMLVVSGTGTLLVKITNFTARKKDKAVVLNWQTANEINNKGFEVQRSADGTSWTKIGFVNSSINSSIEENYE